MLLLSRIHGQWVMSQQAGKGQASCLHVRKGRPHNYISATWFRPDTNIIKLVLCKPLEDNEEMNHSQNRFGKNNPISSHDSLTGFVYKGEGLALVVLWMLSYIACSKARWGDTTGYLMNPKHFLKACSESS